MSMTVLGELSQASFIDFRGETNLARRMIEQLAIRAYGPQQIVGKLSGGNQQKVVVGKWLATKPKVLIVDEPTRGIDVGSKSEIHRLLSELAQQGMAILMISSELPEILGMSDRVLVMRDGRIGAIVTRIDLINYWDEPAEEASEAQDSVTARAADPERTTVR